MHRNFFLEIKVLCYDYNKVIGPKSHVLASSQKMGQTDRQTDWNL